MAFGMRTFTKALGLSGKVLGLVRRESPVLGMAVKSWFFNRKEVTDRMTAATHQVFNRFGATVRKIARRSLKDRAYGIYSSPGKPPYSHRSFYIKKDIKAAKAAGQPKPAWQWPGLKYIFYAYAPNRQSVIIGPARDRPPVVPTVPEILEHGGMSRGRRSKRMVFSVGDFGPVEVGGSRGRWANTPTGKVRVVRIPIKTGRQAARATFLHNTHRLGGTNSSRIAARPFMGPAYRTGMTYLPKMWLDSVKPGGRGARQIA